MTEVGEGSQQKSINKEKERSEEKSPRKVGGGGKIGPEMSRCGIIRGRALLAAYGPEGEGP